MKILTNVLVFLIIVFNQLGYLPCLVLENCGKIYEVKSEYFKLSLSRFENDCREIEESKFILIFLYTFKDSFLLKFQCIIHFQHDYDLCCYLAIVGTAAELSLSFS
jgi:hypothetical protein